MSSFGKRTYYRKIVQFLSECPYASRDEILNALGTSSGGEVSSLLLDLEECGFIDRYVPFHLSEKSRTARYSIADPYLRFYFRFIHLHQKDIEKGRYIKNPLAVLGSFSVTQWLGYSFEVWCRNKAHLIARALGFEGITYTAGPYFERGRAARGFQIDLLFERGDKVISLCEIKYTDRPVGKEVIEEFAKKEARLPMKRSYTLQRVLITRSGVTSEVQESHFFDRILSAHEILLSDEE